MEYTSDGRGILNSLLFLLFLQSSAQGSPIGGNISVNTNLTLHGSPYVVSEDIVVAQNVTLTIQPGVELQFDPGVGLYVKGSLQAKGNSQEHIVFRRTNGSADAQNLNGTWLKKYQIRLHDGNYRVGRLEIYLNGRWGTVCDDWWDMRDTQVACRQLGFLKAKRFYTHGGGTGPIWLDDLGCLGTEKSLLECGHRGIGSHNCGHREDIGIECNVLAPAVKLPWSFAKTVYWKGVDYSGTTKPTSLQYVYISDAYEAIRGRYILPNLYHVTVRNSIYGIAAEEMTFPLAIRDSIIKDSLIEAIRVKGGLLMTTIENTVVDNTTYGDGLSYSGTFRDPLDFCSVDVNNITFPITLQALGKSSASISCEKIIRTQPGRHLTVHYLSISGEMFNLEVHDGNTINTTNLTIVNQWTGVNQAVTPSVSSGHELYIRFQYNGRNGAAVKLLITDGRDFTSLVLSNCSFSDNSGRGVVLKDITGNVTITTSSAFRNKEEGIFFQRFLGKVTTSDSHFINNSAHGLHIENSSLLSCDFHQLTINGNLMNGLYLKRVALLSNIWDSEFEKNAYNGIALHNGAGNIEFRNITAVLNKKSGVKISDGKASTTFLSCNFFKNREDGCCISNQAGSQELFNCSANSNSRQGVSLFDVTSRFSSGTPRHQFKHFSLLDSSLIDNSHYGVKLGPDCQYWDESVVNVTITIINNQIVRNNKAGIFLSPDSCPYRNQRPRKLSATVRNNHFEGNKENTFCVYCTGQLGLDAAIESNKFLNNVDKVLTFVDDSRCWANYQHKINPVHLKITGNIFKKNRVSENVLFIDFSSFPETRSAAVLNNTFNGNTLTTKDRFPKFYHRSTTRAVIVLKEGRFIVRENIIENPGFTFEISTLRHNHRRSVDAKYNWWGTADECEIIDRIFDFRHRIQLSPVEFFPYNMSSTNSPAASSSISRKSCFLRDGSIGGPLDRLLVLSSASSPYEVRDDIIILTNGTLVIPKNVTLQFPPRSAMFVQGTLLVDGTEKEKVKFIKTRYERNFRLAGGSGPWEGRVEFLVNGTWMPLCLPYYKLFSTEAAIICQQQNLKYKRYSRRKLSGMEKGFVHNVACDGDLDEDIMNCSANNWRFGPTCQRYTVYVYCQQHNWVGLHLAMSNHQSSLRHLNIYDAGFPYRDDINIPGAALKIDFNHHNISNIVVNRSDGIGVQVVYHSLLHKKSLMPYSTISNTKSHGIHSLSSITVTHVHMTQNDGNGFKYSGSWRYSSSLGKINTFAADMASPEVNRFFHVCSKNKTFLQANGVFYFTLEELDTTLKLTCQHVIETEPGYTIVIQELYHSHPGYDHDNNFMHVYDGLNKSVGSPWKIEYLSWNDRPVFNSTGSSVLIDFKKSADLNFAIRFQLYTVKDCDRVDHFIGVGINIARCRIVNNVEGGVLINNNVLKYLSIVNSEISNSRGFGIKIDGGSWQNHVSTTDFVLKSCLINRTRANGIYVDSRRMKKVEIVNLGLTNCKRGIYFNMHSYFKNEFVFKNSKISDSLTMGVDIYSNHKENVIRIENSSIIRSGDHGFKFSGNVLRLLVGETTFAWNMKGAFFFQGQNYYHYNQNTVLLTSNTFLYNKGTTVDIYPTKTTLKFVNNTFEGNRGYSVIALGKWRNYYNYRPKAVVIGNRFSANNCTEKAVIYINSDVTDAIIDQNDFLSNTGSCVLLEGSAVRLPISITNNMFNQNDGAEKSIIEAQRVEENTKCVNNTFTLNKAGSLVLFQAVHKLDLSFQRTDLIFNENNLFDNFGHNVSQPSFNGDVCTVVLSGILYYKNVDFRFNKFKNPDFPRELCVRVPAISQRDFVNVTLNWWGTAIGREVRDKISHFDNNYDFAVAKYRPFLLSREDQTLVSSDEYDFQQWGNVLSGRLVESITLKPSQSPYHVTSDFTVLENVTLTIEAGVMIKVSPGVSILVAGELKAGGTISQPVIFTAKEPKSNDIALQLPVRLVGGDFPWEGRVDVFYNMSWKPISVDSKTARNFYSTVCRQLGYNPLTSSSGILNESRQDVNGSWFLDVRCFGGEVFLHECSIKQSFSNNSSSVVAVRCQAAAWGNVRFISSRDLNASQDQSSLEHVEFSYCGNRHGMPVPAIETVTSVPSLRFITVRDCIAGGLRIHFPRSDVQLSNNKFINTGKAGISFLQTRRNIIVESSESSENERGISLEESSAQNVPRVRYGQVFLCNEDQVVSVKNQTLLYFDIPLVKTITSSGKCRKVLQAPKGQRFKLTMLYFKGTQRVKVYDSIYRFNLIVDKSNKDMAYLVHKELFIPRDTIVVEWTGPANSTVVFQVQIVSIIDTPCTFEVGFCGWETFSNMSINRVNATTIWKIGYNTWPLYMGDDYSYFSSNGKRLYVGNTNYDGWRSADGRAVIISPSITKLAQLCSLVFFYRLQQKGKAALSLYIQTGTSARIDQKRIWRARDMEVCSWKKVTISLPTDLDEYRLLLEGEYNESSYYSRNYVAVDNLELRRCLFTAMHRVSNSVFSDNNHQAISYTSVADESDRRPSLTIERCKITGSHAYLSNLFKKRAISLEMQDNTFLLANNFISRNRLGAIQARLGRTESTVVQKCFIYGNTFSSNANGTILLEQREGLESNYSFVYIAENILENNLGGNSTLRLFEIHGGIENNFFYNNSGLYELEYNFFSNWSKGQKCEQNTFYLNRGLGQKYGVTVLSNGPMEYHRNNFKNPSNLYELSTTRQPASDPVHAEMNWWGGGMESAASSRIYEKNDDYRLARVEYKPFQKLPPKMVLSVGCPADWLNVGTTCMTFRGGGKTFKEARDYCQYYGGHVASITTPGDVEFITEKQQTKRPDGKSPVPIWVTTEYNLLQGDGREQKIQKCTVVTHNGTQNVVPCNSLYPFICTRNAVIRCPNSCFHNGDCIGATCFCHPGWTALDCSQFDCKDVHNCSGNGQCVGPNVCKCKPGFMGRGCTYSYCTKFQRCSTCSQGAACGWCDSLQQCLPGISTGPYSRRCPDWFYYTCYTVGNASHCSDNIQRVDCTNRQCNLTQETSNTETCQKCHDLEKCYQNVKEGNCKAWNDTRCPHGLVKVDYTDSNRKENTLLRSNVKVINPNTTKIYSCPVMIPDAEDTTLIIVPRSLDIKTGDVLSSPQAGGLMHKVNETTKMGPYMMMLGTPARIEEIIQYADFTERVSPVQLVDESTVDEEPELDDLNGFISKNITLNNSNVHVLDSNMSVFKCVGHIYRVQEEFVASQFLLIDKEHAKSVRPEDVIVSAQSHGFIEKVIAINRTSDMVFLETKLERCTENSTWAQRIKRHQSGSSDSGVFCTGGDNNYGLIVTELDVEHQNISVNDSIVGRSSNPFIAKVINANVNGDLMMIEVLPVLSIVNGTAVTAVQVDELRKGHGRQKREVDIKETITFQKTFKKQKKFKLPGGGYISAKQTFGVKQDFIISMGVFTKRDDNGNIVNVDAVFGLKMAGKVTYNVDVEIGIERSVVIFEKTYDIGKPVQIGSFCVPVYAGICIPCALFLEAKLVASLKFKGKISVPISFKSSANLAMGGSCSLSGGCQTESPQVTVSRSLTNGRITTGCEFNGEIKLVPKLTFKLPTVPRWMRKLVIIFRRKILRKVFKRLGYKPNRSSTKKQLSLLELSVEVPYTVNADVIICSKKCMKNPNKPFEFKLNSGFSKISGKLTVGFGQKNFEKPMSYNLPAGGLTPASFCFSVADDYKGCGCQTTAPPTTSASTTPPPTTPPPCECANGERGLIASDGSCECPPECPKGRKAVFVNKRYQCPEHPSCGEYPNCVVGRKGPGCSQPDVPGCSSDCSGNGVAVALVNCGSRCACSARWTGTCCERRRPWRNWGDPHLETLDGIDFDYFGIGEFWGCKSIFNDFGLQFRYFAYQRASLTGGVAIKTGQSILTIMTINTTNPRAFPKLRVDGALLNITANYGQKIVLGNGTVIMDIQKAFSNESEETGIMLLSLQFESGLTVTTDVRYSHVMGRQYLNVLFTPTVAFKSHTEGLCGVMDNDPSNDLRGPRGEQYNDPIQFADSWRITAVQSNSSFQETWSWNSSNFHNDDVMDWSYIDPNFLPVYSLDGIDAVIVAKATAACSSLGLSKAMQDSCIYDVAVTNDTSLTAQETLQQDCPDQCSGKGRCVNSTCHCMIGWTGDSCQLGDCTNCSAKHGTCVKGFCECEDGWEGATCEHKATCFNVNNCTSPNNGICRRTDQCRCHDGFIGIDCSIVPTCSNVSDCSGRGICIDYDVCKCQKEWTGNNCTQYSCASLDFCSGQGRCVAPFKCSCNPGWTGESCAAPDCAGANQCSGQGDCVSSNTCQCYPGFQGANCSDVTDCSMLGNCSGKGICIQEKLGGNLTCRCFAGFSGANCSIPSCLNVNNCSGHGLCIEADFCKCDVGYTGADCANASCESLNYCSGHGVCAGYDKCACDPLWHGVACSLANCSSLNDCSNKGDCILPNTCECYPGYDGAACNTTAKPNLHAPVFPVSLYNLSLSENIPKRTKVLRVQASDADSGRNGQLFFSIDDSQDVNSAFTIDSLSGDIFTLSAFDYESSSKKLHKLKVIASDNGIPRKSSSVFVYISIDDQNDHCPIFRSPQMKFWNISRNTPPGTPLTVISADDEDSGLNGEVRYSLSYASNHEGTFKVDERSGEFATVGVLKAEEYRLQIIARDLGVPSCSRQIELTVRTFVDSEATEAPSEITTGVRTEATRKSETTLLTRATTSQIPEILPPSKSWYKEPSFIIGISFGGFIVLVVIPLAILCFWKWKCCKSFKVKDTGPSLGSHNEAMSESQITVHSSPCMYGDIQNRSSETYEMKNVSHVQ